METLLASLVLPQAYAAQVLGEVHPRDTTVNLWIVALAVVFVISIFMSRKKKAGRRATDPGNGGGACPHCAHTMAHAH